MEIVNGLSSATKFYQYRENGDTVEYHEHPKTGQLVILRTWHVSDGDCVSSEFEVEGVYPAFAVTLAKLNVPFMVAGKHALAK